MLLLDTCTFLWLVGKEDKLSEPARELIQQHAGSLYVSAISAFEIGTKFSKGRLKLPVVDPYQWFTDIREYHQMFEIPVTSEIAMLSTQLPALHRDPSDRIIVATAQVNSMEILTPDQLIHDYPGVKVRW